MGIFANLKAMKDVQKIKNGGSAYFTVSAITNLIINLPDAQKTLDRTAFDKVFELYKKFNKCTTKLELNYEGYLATAVDILREFDKIAPCESYLGIEPVEAILLMKEVRKVDSEFLNDEKVERKTEIVTIFHVARNQDGTIQPVVAAQICPTNTDLIKSLLCTDDLGVDEVSHKDTDYYYFLYDKKSARPFPSVMILKFLQCNGEKTYVDMKQEDMKAVTYVIDNYLN